jgi:hypothetical protein
VGDHTHAGLGAHFGSIGHHFLFFALSKRFQRVDSVADPVTIRIARVMAVLPMPFTRLDLTA